MRGLNIPDTKMGRVSAFDTLEDREQVAFDFYEAHADRYRKVLDIGANVGIHSILMARLGWEVTSYEPDPEIFQQLTKNLLSNGCYPGGDGRAYMGGDRNVTPINAAVATSDGYAEFIKVMDNRTASHLAGARESHGPIEKLRVPTIGCRALFAWADFAKIDCEGSEAELLCTVTDEKCEFMVEVGTALNAAKIFEHFNGRRKMWSQRTGWGEVKSIADMPVHFSHGALFIGKQP